VICHYQEKAVTIDLGYGSRIMLILVRIVKRSLYTHVLNKNLLTSSQSPKIRKTFKTLRRVILKKNMFLTK